MYTPISEKFVRQAMDSNGKYSAMLWIHIVCDTFSDMPEPLPHWSAGSRCDVLENGGSAYELSHSGQWMPIENPSGDVDLAAITSGELIEIWEAD